MKPTSALPILGALLAIAAPSFAQPDEPPTIVITETEREVRANVRADGDSESDVQTTTSGGPFVAGVSEQTGGMYGSSSFAAATQDSQISSFVIEGVGTAEGGASRGAGEDAKASASGSSQINVSFTVPVDAPYSLSGSFTAMDDFTDGCLTFGNVGFAGINADNQVFFHSAGYCDEDPPEEMSFLFTGTAKAETTLTFGISVDAYAEEDDQIVIPGTGTASFQFTLDFGDRDGDGLLNVWEEEGIDIDADGTPEIDLPTMGANPDKKDLFVEVDVMSGLLFDPAGFLLVEEAFSEAPSWMVDNPDNSKGINLHVIWDDGDAPPNQPLVDPFNGPPSQMQAIKQDFFGSASDRSLGNWSQIREARLKVFRYCLIGDSLTKDGTVVSGLGEEPGNDLILNVAALSRSEQATKGLAGFFMHELGHTLGLRHGGEDAENFKPNYLSVMNYAYAVPYLVDDPEGHNFADYWRLDYSRSAPHDLDENNLMESDGLNGPRGRAILFNSSPTSPSVKTFGWAKSPMVDWNNNHFIDPSPYPLDISRSTESQDVSHDILKSYTDWDRLWYHLSGAPTFNEEAASDPSFIREGMSLNDMDDLLSGDWVDQTALGDLIFENGFELGSTTAWSETVP